MEGPGLVCPPFIPLRQDECGSPPGSAFPCLPLAWLALMLIPAFLHSLDLTAERPSRAWEASVTWAGIWAGFWAALSLGLSLQHPNMGRKVLLNMTVGRFWQLLCSGANARTRVFGKVFVSLFFPMGWWYEWVRVVTACLGAWRKSPFLTPHAAPTRGPDGTGSQSQSGPCCVG